MFRCSRIFSLDPPPLPHTLHCGATNQRSSLKKAKPNSCDDYPILSHHKLPPTFDDITTFVSLTTMFSISPMPPVINLWTCQEEAYLIRTVEDVERDFINLTKTKCSFCLRRTRVIGHKFQLFDIFFIFYLNFLMDIIE